MLFYAAIKFIRPAAHIILTPVYLHCLSESEFGLNDLMLIFGAFLMIVVTFRLNSAMLTHYYDYHTDAQASRKYLKNLFSFSILIALITAAIFMLIGEPLFRYVFSSDEITFYPYGWIVLGYALLGEINATYYIYLRNEKDLVGVTYVSFGQIIPAILLQLLFVIVFDWGVVGMLLGNFLSCLFIFILILLRERDILTLSFDRDMITRSLRFAMALVPYLAIYWVLTKGGKIFLERYADLPTVALFALMITLASIIILCVEAIINGIRPFLFEIFATDRAEWDEDKVDLLTKMIVNFPLLVIPAVVLVANHIGLITSKAVYQELPTYMNWMCLCTFVLVYAKLFYQQLIFVKRSDLVTVLSFVVMLALFWSFHILVPSLQIWGVIWAMLIGNALMALFFYVAAQRQLPLHYELKSILFIPILFFVCLFLIEHLTISIMGCSRSSFGIIQFVLLISLVIGLNWRSLKSYKRIFSY